MQVGSAITAIRAGYELRRAETWKNRTIAVNALTALLTLGLAVARAFGVQFEVSDEVLAAVASGVWGVVGVFSAWSTAATSARVGLPARRDDNRLDGDRGSADGPGDRYPGP